MEDYEVENSSPFSVDDGLSPLQRLENYIESENLFSRQVFLIESIDVKEISLYSSSFARISRVLIA